MSSHDFAEVVQLMVWHSCMQPGGTYQPGSPRGWAVCGMCAVSLALATQLAWQPLQLFSESFAHCISITSGQTMYISHCLHCVKKPVLRAS